MNLWKGSTVVLLVALAYIISQKTVNAAQAEPQSQMKIALGHLELSKAALERATVDKGGHRLRAIELTEDAIAQVRQVVDDDTR